MSCFYDWSRHQGLLAAGSNLFSSLVSRSRGDVYCAVIGQKPGH